MVACAALNATCVLVWESIDGAPDFTLLGVEKRAVALLLIRSIAEN